MSHDVADRADLSGEWHLDADRSDAVPDLDALRANEEKQLLRGVETDPMESIQLVNLYFPAISTGSILIEQEEEGMGVQFEGQPYKDLSWGRQKLDGWTQTVGWDKGSLVIRSFRGAIRGTQEFKLLDEGTVLEVVISIKVGDEKLDLRRLFQRESVIH